MLCQDVTTVVVGVECSGANKRQFNSMLSEIRRHPVGVTCVNLLYVIESLFGFAAVAPLLGSNSNSSSGSSSSASVEDFHSRIPGYRVDFSGIQSTEDLVDCTKFYAPLPPPPTPVTAAAAAAVDVQDLFSDAATTTAAMLMSPPKGNGTTDKRRGGGGNFLKDFQNKRKLTQLTGSTAAAAPSPSAAGANAAANGGFTVPSGGPSSRTRLTRSHNLNDESQVVTYGDSEHRY